MTVPLVLPGVLALPNVTLTTTLTQLAQQEPATLLVKMLPPGLETPVIVGQHHHNNEQAPEWTSELLLQNRQLELQLMQV